MQITTQKYFSSVANYSHSYQGSEKDDEIKGEGNSYTTHFRMLDPRIGRWMSVDPVVHPWESPYVSMANNPIALNDPLGNDVIIDAEGKEKRELKKTIRQGSRKSETFKANYKALEMSNKVHTITVGTGIRTYADGSTEECTWCTIEDGETGNTSIYVDLNNLPKTDLEGVGRINTLIIALGHEMGHSWMIENNLDEIEEKPFPQKWIKDRKEGYIQNPNYKPNSIPNTVFENEKNQAIYNETGASNIENLIRHELGVQLRQSYTITYKEIDSSNKIRMYDYRIELCQDINALYEYLHILRHKAI